VYTRAVKERRLLGHPIGLGEWAQVARQNILAHDWSWPLWTKKQGSPRHRVCWTLILGTGRERFVCLQVSPVVMLHSLQTRPWGNWLRSGCWLIEFEVTGRTASGGLGGLIPYVGGAQRHLGGLLNTELWSPPQDSVQF
jgi:hypothetical protein